MVCATLATDATNITNNPKLMTVSAKKVMTGNTKAPQHIGNRLPQGLLLIL